MKRAMAKLCFVGMLIFIACQAYAAEQKGFYREPNKDMSKAALKLIDIRNRLTDEENIAWKQAEIDASLNQREAAEIRAAISATEARISELQKLMTETDAKANKLATDKGGQDKLTPEERTQYDEAKADVVKSRALAASAGRANDTRRRDLAEIEERVESWAEDDVDTKVRTSSGHPDKFEEHYRTARECYREACFIIKYFVNGERYKDIDLDEMREFLEKSPADLPADVREKLQMLPDGSFKHSKYGKAFTNPRGAKMMTKILLKYQQVNGLSEADAEITKKMLVRALSLAIESQASYRITDAGKRAKLLGDAQKQTEEILSRNRVSLYDIISMYDLLIEANPEKYDPDR